MKLKGIIVLLIFTSFQVYGRGYLLLIGGGSESDDSLAWNRLPYSWAIQMSQNKKVALISYNNESNWLPNYFVSQCGANAAKNFRINTTNLANSQATYDSLMTYDVIFLKGGDQYNYYSTYRNTKTAQAIQNKFDQGGVICGTSAGLAVMSNVIFTALTGTAYPDECLENPNNSYVNLADDFLSLFPGYLFDSHFNDRARLGRLLAFMAHWKFTHNETITGLGVDERTAMTIDSNLIGTVYGTGAVTLVKPYDQNTFSLANNHLRADSVKYIQLLHQCTIDFNTGHITGLPGRVDPDLNGEYRNYTLYMSGDDPLSSNQQMIQMFCQEGSLGDSVLIICNNPASVSVQAVINLLGTMGATNVKAYEGSPANASNIQFENEIVQCRKLLFMENEWYVLEHFLNNGSTGPKLKIRMAGDGMILSFIGDNSRFAGRKIIDNYLLPNAANTGSLVIKNGLGLLNTTIVFPNAYENTNMYVNGAAGLPYVMIKDSLRYGIQIDKSGFIRYAADHGQTYFRIYGGFPSFILQNEGCQAGLANQPGSSGSSTIRNIAGFDRLRLSVLNHGDSLLAGDHISLTGIDGDDVHYCGNFSVARDGDWLIVRNPDHQSITMNIIDMQGRVIYTANGNSTIESIPLERLLPGLHVLKVASTARPEVMFHKFIP